MQRERALTFPGFRAKKAWHVQAAGVARRKPLGTASAIVLILLTLVAIFAGKIDRYDPITVQRAAGAALQAPSAKHWLGTDQAARDVWSRLIHGSRISFYVGFIAVGIGIGVGGVVGVISGYYMGWFDLLMQRGIDVILGFPALILVLALASVLEPNTTNAMLAIAFILWPGVARVVRGAVISITQNPYVDAAKAIGAGNLRIMLRHVAPQTFAPVIVLASVDLGSAIIVEASLSFLGLGTQPPTPSWGLMLSEGRKYIENSWWLAVAPGVAISLMVLAFNLMGDTLRDVLDPRLRGS